MSEARAEFVSFLESVERLRSEIQSFQKEIHRLELIVVDLKAHGLVTKVASMEARIDALERAVALLEATATTVIKLEDGLRGIESWQARVMGYAAGATLAGGGLGSAIGWLLSGG